MTERPNRFSADSLTSTSQSTVKKSIKSAGCSEAIAPGQVGGISPKYTGG
jgi:hypothetical protein